MEYTSTTCHFAPVFPYRPELRRKRPQVPQPPRGFPPIESDWVVEFEQDTPKEVIDRIGQYVRAV